MVKLDKEGFKVYGDIMLYNPNKMGVKLNDILMNIELNDKHVATAGQKEPVSVKAKSEFAVPLNLTIKPDMTLSEGLTNIINIIKKKEIKVTINGVIVVKAFGVKVSIPIKQDEKVDLTKLK
jgi:LEA14-like dessication related protein